MRETIFKRVFTHRFLDNLRFMLSNIRKFHVFSLPGQSPGRAIVLPPASALAALAKC